MKLVSVIIPFYNTDESVFTQCLNSINDSVYKDIEIIIVDDGSRKALADFLDGIPLKFVDLQVHVFHQKNSGPSAARNLGMNNDKVVFTGIIDDAYNVIQAMDLFLLPSFYEGLCLAAVEIQACGIPCLFSDCVANETQINPNVDFFSLDDSSDVINTKINKLLAMERRIDKAKFAQRGFDIQVEAAKLDKFYKRRMKDEYMEHT